MNETKSEFLRINSKTWTRDSHGLFDYESSTVRENILLLRGATKLFRKKHEIREKKEEEIREGDDQLMCSVFYEKNKFILSTNLEKGMQPSEYNINELQNKIWYIIKPEVNLNPNQNQNPNIKNENESFSLKLNDVMKLGRIKYVITDLCLNGVLSSIENDDSGAVFKLILDYNESIIDPEITCKYCLSHDCFENTPLIKLCVCSESMSVHYGCVKKWIGVKLSHKKNEKESVFSYNMKSFNCDICKTPYPRKSFWFLVRFRHNSKTQNLIDLTRPSDKNYMILESLNQVKDGNNYKSIHVITLEAGQKTVMGRGHEADVRINDISVSRLHGTISLEEDNKTILLRDLGSKFGTLALIQGNFTCSDKKVCLQIGRSYMEVRQFPISDYLVAQQEQKDLEKNNQIKDAKKLQLAKNHSHNHQHKENLPAELRDLREYQDGFDLAGIRDVIENSEISQIEIYNMIQRRNQGILDNNLNTLNRNFNMMYGGNRGSNNQYMTNPRERGERGEIDEKEEDRNLIYKKLKNNNNNDRLSQMLQNPRGQANQRSGESLNSGNIQQANANINMFNNLQGNIANPNPNPNGNGNSNTNINVNVNTVINPYPYRSNQINGSQQNPNGQNSQGEKRSSTNLNGDKKKK